MSATSTATLLRPSPRPVNGAPAGPKREPGPSPGIARWLSRSREGILAQWFRAQFDPGRIARYPIVGLEGQSPSQLCDRFLKPLFDLLLAYARTGNRDYRCVYLDERLRFSPRRSDPGVRAEFFSELLVAHEAAILEEVPSDPRLWDVIRGFWADLHEPLLTTRSKPPMRILALGDCLMTELRVFLQNSLREAGIDVDMRELYFSALQKQEMSPQEVVHFLQHFPADLIAMSFLSYEGLPPYSALMQEADRLSAADIDRYVVSIAGLIREYLVALRERTEAPFLLHNVSGLPLTRYRKRIPGLPPMSRGRRKAIEVLNAAIGELAENTPNTILIDEREIAKREGYRRCSAPVVPRRIARGAYFHTARFGSYLAGAYLDVVRSFQALRKAKVIAVDFDGTLWDGVMAEGPVVHRYQAQELLRRLREAGILLVAASKNDPANVRWDEMRLAESDFVLQKINWNHKVESIRQAAAELDLGLDSFVLLDDDPVQREFVHSELPSVAVLDSGDPFTWRALGRVLQFPNTRQTEEAKSRTEMYRIHARRREVLLGSLDYGSMLASLKLVVRFGRARRRDLARIGELVQRTNQFNTTTIRYSPSQLAEYLKSESHAVYVADVSDRFGELGIVGVVVVKRAEQSPVIESFVMSCRAMGLMLERLMLHKVVELEKRAGTIVGCFVPTDRNTPAAGLFPDAGFAPAGDGEWIHDARNPLPNLPDWFTVIDRW